MKKHIASALSVAFLALAALPAVAQNQAWIRQFGTGGNDHAYATASDGLGGVYVSGLTTGSLGGPSAGMTDAWLARYDNTGNQTWIRQFGSPDIDIVYAAAPDGSGGVFVGGYTYGSLAGTNAGNWDAWLARYDAIGNQTWIRQLGTSAHDVTYAAAPDGIGGVYVGGATDGSLGAPTAGVGDGWLAHYDGAGNRTWIRQFGTSGEDGAWSAASDNSGGVYVTGLTSGSLGGPNAGYGDVWLARYDSAGNRSWIRQFGTNDGDAAWAATPDGLGGVFVGGETWGILGGPNAGSRDAWLARYDGAGNETWTRQLGTSSPDGAFAAAPDGSGGVYVGGWTNGGLSGPSVGNSDAWLARYDSAGIQAWILQLGTSGTDQALTAAPDGTGGVYVGGFSTGSLGGPNAGGDDAWLVHYDVPCGTSSSFCTAGTTTHGCVPSISGTGSASASAGNGFTISVNSVEGAQSGLIFYGLSGAVAFPWGTSSSFMCVKSPLERTPVQNSGGAFGLCNGVLSLDWNLYRASNPLSLGSPFVGGEQVRAQAWFRDPPSPKTTNLSNGLLFSVCP